MPSKRHIPDLLPVQAHLPLVRLQLPMTPQSLVQSSATVPCTTSGSRMAPRVNIQPCCSLLVRCPLEDLAICWNHRLAYQCLQRIGLCFAQNGGMLALLANRCAAWGLNELCADLRLFVHRAPQGIRDLFRSPWRNTELFCLQCHHDGHDEASTGCTCG